MCGVLPEDVQANVSLLQVAGMGGGVRQTKGTIILFDQ